MTSFIWGADAPMFNDRELRRVARQLRMALAAIIEEQPTWPGRPGGAERQRPSGERGPRPTNGPDVGTDQRNARAPFCGEGTSHHHPHGLHPGFVDDATREAWREHLRAACVAMMTDELADPEGRRARADEGRPTGPRGGGGKGKHRRHREDGPEGGTEHEGGPRRGRPEGEQGGPGWGGPGRPGGWFGPFGPFGSGAGGPGRGMRGRGGPGWRFEGGRGRASRGDVRLAILALLSEGPRHGYQLIQDITERSEGAWAPSPGSIYPALSSLQDEGLIDDEKLEGRRVFSLTEAGRAYVAERQEQVDGVFSQNSPTSEHEALAEVGVLMWGVGEAALTVLGTGTESQRADARDLLARTRRDLFRILAEETFAQETTEEDVPTDSNAEATQTEATPESKASPESVAAPASDATPSEGDV